MSRPRKRSFAIAGHRTSVSLEEPFWEALREIASAEATTLSHIVARVDATPHACGLSTALRLHILDYYRVRAGLGSAAS